MDRGAIELFMTRVKQNVKNDFFGYWRQTFVENVAVIMFTVVTRYLPIRGHCILKHFEAKRL